MCQAACGEVVQSVSWWCQCVRRPVVRWCSLYHGGVSVPGGPWRCGAVCIMVVSMCQAACGGVVQSVSWWCQCVRRPVVQTVSWWCQCVRRPVEVWCSLYHGGVNVSGGLWWYGAVCIMVVSMCQAACGAVCPMWCQCVRRPVVRWCSLYHGGVNVSGGLWCSLSHVVSVCQAACGEVVQSVSWWCQCVRRPVVQSVPCGVSVSGGLW